MGRQRIPLVDGVTAERRTVYVYGGRSFLSRRSAEMAAARREVGKEIGNCDDDGDGPHSPARCNVCRMDIEEFRAMARRKLAEMRSKAAEAEAAR